MSLKYRKFKPGDRTPVYRMFRKSIWDYMLQHGIASPESAAGSRPADRPRRGLPHRQTHSLVGGRRSPRDVVMVGRYRDNSPTENPDDPYR